MDRTVESILVEWRRTEAELDERDDPELAARIDQLRDEHAAALAKRRDAADELGRTPGTKVGTEPR